MGSGWEGVWVCVFVCFDGVVIFRDALLYLFCSCSLHISTDIKRHQIARNSPWLCMAAKRVAGILPSQKVRVEIRDKMPFEVDYSWEGSRSSFTHITRCSSPPFFAPDYTEEKRLSCFECHTSLKELHWSSLLCKFRMSWCLCQEAQRSKDIFQPRGLTEV